MNGFLNLKDKMNDWGPFSPASLGILIFSIGNPREGHGSALSLDNDSRCANFVAYQVAERSGARFIASIPYTTDRAGDIALDWSPVYIPMEECAEKSSDFIKYHCRALVNQGISVSNIVVINGHGGNMGMEDFPVWAEMEDELDLSLEFASTFTVDIDELLETKNYSDETREAYWIAARTAGHADTMEHSVATLYGGIDYGKYYQVNDPIKRDLDEALRK